MSVDRFAPDLTLYALASAVLAALESRYEESPHPHALPERRYVSDGEPAWDDPQLTVRVVRTFPFVGNLLDETPQAWTPGPSPLQFAAEMEIELLRPAPNLGAEGEDHHPPTAPTIDANAEVILADSYTIPLMLEDAYTSGELSGCGGVMFNSWASRGPEGGLVGGVHLMRLVIE